MLDLSTRLRYREAAARYRQKRLPVADVVLVDCRYCGQTLLGDAMRRKNRESLPRQFQALDFAAGYRGGRSLCLDCFCGRRRGRMGVSGG